MLSIDGLRGSTKSDDVKPNIPNGMPQIDTQEFEDMIRIMAENLKVEEQLVRKMFGEGSIQIFENEQMFMNFVRQNKHLFKEEIKELGVYFEKLILFYGKSNLVKVGNKVVYVSIN